MAQFIELVEYDPEWRQKYAREAKKIRIALGGCALRVEHVGSTAVPGLAAKPIIDIVLEVADSRDEPHYAPDLEAAGYELRIREPNWHEHRLFKDANRSINLHVFSSGCPEIDRMLKFRDWLRANGDDRNLYASTKRALAEHAWNDTEDYANAKSAVVNEILSRVLRGTTK